MSIRPRVWTTAKGEQRAWLVDYHDQGGTRRTKQFKRRKDADAFEVRAKGEVRDGIHVPDAATVTVAAAAALWLASGDAAGLERTTIDQRRSHINLHINPRLGTLRLNKITVATVRAFQDWMRENGSSAAMQKKVSTSLSSILTEATELGLLTRNPMVGRKRTAGASRKRRLEVGVDIPTPGEIGRLRAALDTLPLWRPALLVAIFTGLRASELRGLRWSDIDMQNTVLHVRQRADRYNVIGRLKTKAATRSIPIGPLLVNTLREWRIACPPSPLGLAFPDRHGGVLTHWAIVECGLQPAMRRAKLLDGKGRPKYPGLHALRHFFASWMINRQSDGGRELPPKTVQERLGHSSIVMTLDTYGHLFPVIDTERLAADEARLWGV